MLFLKITSHTESEGKGDRLFEVGGSRDFAWCIMRQNLTDDGDFEPTKTSIYGIFLYYTCLQLLIVEGGTLRDLTSTDLPAHPLSSS